MELSVFARGRVASVPRGGTPRLGDWDEERRLPTWQLYGVTLDGHIFMGAAAWERGDDFDMLEAGVDYFSVNGLQCSYIINYDEADEIWSAMKSLTVGSDVRLKLPLSYGTRRGSTYPAFQVGLVEEIEVIELGSARSARSELSLAGFSS